MALTKSITAENMWSDPILVPPGNRLLYQVNETTAPFVATLSLQQNIDISDPAQPGTAATNWKTAKKIDSAGGGDPVVSDVTTYGGAWFRMGVATGDFTGGVGLITLKIVNL